MTLECPRGRMAFLKVNPTPQGHRDSEQPSSLPPWIGYQGGVGARLAAWVPSDPGGLCTLLAVAPWGLFSPLTAEKTIALLSQADMGANVVSGAAPALV